VGSTGWNFTPQRDIVVTELGFYDVDSSGLGLANGHNVGIFRRDTPGIPVVAAVISAFTKTVVDGSVGRTYFESVSPTTLYAGVEYDIVSNYFGVDLLAASSQSVVFSPDFVWNGYVYPANPSQTNIFGQTFVTDLFGVGVPGNIGPNFRYY